MQALLGKKRNSTIFVASLLLILSACSSSETKNEGDEFGEPAPATEASTDAVPQDSVEAPPGAPAQDAAPAPAEAASAAAPQEAPADSGAVASQDPPVAPADAAAQVQAPAESAHVDPAPAVAASDAESYTVKKGDTLMMIAFETYGDLFQWRKIFDGNRDQLKDPNHIPPGTVLKLERGTRIAVSHNGEQYQIKKGDTLGTISRDVYGTPKKWKRLWENNKELIHDPNKIFAGFYLYYTMTPEDQQQRKEQGNRPAPLAKKHPTSAPTASNGDSRDPASVGGTHAMAPAQPAAPPVVAPPPVAPPAYIPPVPAAPRVVAPPPPAPHPAEAPAPSFWDRLKKWR